MTKHYDYIAIGGGSGGIAFHQPRGYVRPEMRAD